MGAVLSPECNQPLFLIESAEAARACGRSTGLLLGLVLGIVVAGALVGSRSPSSDDPKRQGRGGSVRPWLGAAAALVLCPLGLAMLLGSLQAWRRAGLEASLSAYERTGMSRSEALQQLQKWQATQVQSSAILGAGALAGHRGTV